MGPEKLLIVKQQLFSNINELKKRRQHLCISNYAKGYLDILTDETMPQNIGALC